MKYPIHEPIKNLICVPQLFIFMLKSYVQHIILIKYIYKNFILVVLHNAHMMLTLKNLKCYPNF
jgi:hypothetical protein